MNGVQTCAPPISPLAVGRLWSLGDVSRVHVRIGEERIEERVGDILAMVGDQRADLAACRRDRAVAVIGLQPLADRLDRRGARSEEHTSELQSLMRISYAVFCLKKKKTKKLNRNNNQ